MRLYLENENLHHAYVTDCIRIYLTQEDYVTLDLQGEHNYSPDFLQEKFKGDALVWDEFKDGKLISYADEGGKEVENTDLVPILLIAERIVCLLDPQSEDAGLWAIACDAVEGMKLIADGRIEIDLAGGTHALTGQFELDTEVRK